MRTVPCADDFDVVYQTALADGFILSSNVHCFKHTSLAATGLFQASNPVQQCPLTLTAGFLETVLCLQIKSILPIIESDFDHRLLNYRLRCAATRTSRMPCSTNRLRTSQR